MSTVETAPTPPIPEGSLTGLVAGIISDAQTLIRQQAEMLKAEVREDLQRSKRAAEYGAVGIVCATVGALGLVAALAYLLHEQFQFAMWASCGIVGGLFLLVGLALGGFSYVLLERFNPLPDKTFNALKENITWQTK
jgi:predicted lysophospholipase L1 biosynthesis ABC-type transport system permease subunit